MSEENVEVVRRAMAAFNARDRDRALSMCDPEIELWSPFEQKTYRGLEEMVQWREVLAAAMEDFHMEDTRASMRTGIAWSFSIESGGVAGEPRQLARRGRRPSRRGVEGRHGPPSRSP
jgi:SnoaL-like domain